jgi:hypothetical protein
MKFQISLGNYHPHMKFQISLPQLVRHHESKSALTARYAILLLYLGQHNGFTGQSIQEAFSGCSCQNSGRLLSRNCVILLQTVKSPCTLENTLRTFIQRRIPHKLERHEESAQKISCMYLCSFYFMGKNAEMPALATDIPVMKNLSAPKVFISKLSALLIAVAFVGVGYLYKKIFHSVIRNSRLYYCQM